MHALSMVWKDRNWEWFTLSSALEGMTEEAQAAGVGLPKEIIFPEPFGCRASSSRNKQRATTRSIPTNTIRPTSLALLTQWPKDFTIDLEKVLGQRPKPAEK
jgi:hypothetical protein